MSLREDLADWTDWDVAAQAYGRAIGVFAGATERQVRRALMTANPIGDALNTGLDALATAGVLERRDDPEDQFRWVFGGPEALPGAAESAAVDSHPVALDLPQLSASHAEPAPARKWWQRR